MFCQKHHKATGSVIFNYPFFKFFFVSLKIAGLILFEVFNPYPANVENMVIS